MGKIRIEVELDEDTLKEHIYEAMAARYSRDFSPERRQADRVVAEQVRKVIYADKERITEMVVSRAASHVKNLAARKLAEKMMEGDG